MSIETVDQVRLRNLKFLLEQYKDEVRSQYPEHPERGMIKMFAERVGVSVINFRQVLNGHKLAGPNLRDRIEDALKLPRGWIDTDHSSERVTKHLAEDDELREFTETVAGLYLQYPEASRSALQKWFHSTVTGKPLEGLEQPNGKKNGGK